MADLPMTLMVIFSIYVELAGDQYFTVYTKYIHASIPMIFCETAGDTKYRFISGECLG